MKKASELLDALISLNEHDSNGEPANVVDSLFAVARAIRQLAEAVEGSGRKRGGDEAQDD